LRLASSDTDPADIPMGSSVARGMLYIVTPIHSLQPSLCINPKQSFCCITS